ncbi:hypothetical protein [Parageobacillus genomosp. 1]|uniref:hypothetical protein n=1 Tax=Parageobacillus genomosp. 1 TaxID=1295642 RepID=UPI0005C71360|nr:hypothetical protein [Parageobacillus genomosp. 1]
MKKRISVRLLLLTMIVMFQVTLFQAAEAKMSVTRTLPGNVFSTGEHLFFLINVAGGTAKQPSAPTVPVLTGLNSTLSTADFGRISRSLINIVTVADVVNITNKSSSAKFLSVSVVNGSAPLLGSLRSILSFPDNVTVNPGQTVSINATISTNLLTTRLGEYTGWIKITDTETNLSYSIPVQLVVDL